MANSVQDNSATARYEMQVEGKTAFITYRRAGTVVTLLHAEVPPELAGHGVGSALTRGTLELARARGDKVIARCPFIVTYIRRHAEFQSLLAAPEHAS
jgi:uncharacterized protein